MVGPSVRPGRIDLLEQLMVLSPLARIVAGGAMLAVGVASILLLVSFYSFVLLGAGVAIGVPLVWSGWSAQREQEVERTERARAEVDLPYLRDFVAAAVKEHRNVARLLRERGYTSDKVRRWIALECGVVLHK